MRIGGLAVRKRALPLVTVVMLVGLLCVSQSGQALTITFEATDLTMPGPMGGDLWQYTYHLSGFTPQANVAFEVTTQVG